MEWKDIWDEEFKKEYFVKLRNWVGERRKANNVLPGSKDIMAAMKLCPFDRVKIVIIGQDPYPNPKHAHGLAFSSKSNDRPESVSNIFKEIKNQLYPEQELGELFPTNDLTCWAERGVLLLNRVLTVDEGKPESHWNMGWETFTGKIIEVLTKYKDGIVFMLWGKKAQEVEKLIKPENNLILKSPHPSPLSAHKGFFGNNHFIEANKFLQKFAFRNVKKFLIDHMNQPGIMGKLKEEYRLMGIEFGTDESFKGFIDTQMEMVAEFPAEYEQIVKDYVTINFKTVKNE